MALDLYRMPLSPPCHPIRMLAKAMNLQLNLIHLDLLKGEHLKPEFLKINPQHVIPTLVDNDLVLWESRAIMIYLCEKYGRNDRFYPRDPEKRAVVNQRLYFDAGTLYQRFSDHFYPALLHGKETFEESTLKRMEEAFEFLDTFLDKSEYVAGDSVTIADFSVLASITTMKVAAELDFSKYANIERWYRQVSAEVSGHDEICIQGAREFLPLFEQAKKVVAAAASK